MNNSVEIDVKVKSDDRDLRRLKRGFDRLDDPVKKLDKAFDKVGDRMRRIDRTAGRLDRRLDDVDVDRLNRGLRTAQDRLSRLNNSAGRLGGVMNQGIRGLAGFAGTATGLVIGGSLGLILNGALYDQINKSADRMDELAKKSRALDFEPKTLQQLRYVNDLSNANPKTFDTGLTNLLGQTALAKGGDKAALSKLPKGLRERVVGSTSGQDALLLVADAIQSAKTHDEAKAISTAAFGIKAGSSLITVFRQTEDAIAKLKAESDRLQYPPSQKDLDNAEALGDSQTRVIKSWLSVLDASSAKLFPELTRVQDETADKIAENREKIASKIEGFGLRAVAAFESVDWEKVGGGLERIGDGLLSLTKGITNTLEFIGNPGGVVKEDIIEPAKVELTKTKALAKAPIWTELEKKTDEAYDRGEIASVFDMEHVWRTNGFKMRAESNVDSRNRAWERNTVERADVNRISDLLDEIEENKRKLDEGNEYVERRRLDRNAYQNFIKPFGHPSAGVDNSTYSSPTSISDGLVEAGSEAGTQLGEKAFIAISSTLPSVGTGIAESFNIGIQPQSLGARIAEGFNANVKLPPTPPSYGIPKGGPPRPTLDTGIDSP